MKYNEDMLDQMAEQIDLLEYAENTMEFVKKGKQYFTHCPLHIDNTPSLCITPEVNKWYCHSCHRGGTIYGWIQTFENKTFQESVERVSELTGTEYEEYIESETVSIYKEINKCNRVKPDEKIERKILDFNVDYLSKYKDEIPNEWVKEGILPDVMKIYNIKVDNNSRRIVYPVLDQQGNFVSVKGRTRLANFKDLGIPKYINFYPVGVVDYMQGWQVAEKEIKNKNTVIIFEGIKSCMKSYGWGIRNTVASETSELSEGQIKFLIKNGLSEVIIAWDNDKSFQEIINNDKIQMLKWFTKVSVIHDKKGLLCQDKMAPVDAGEEIYKKLLRERVII